MNRIPTLVIPMFLLCALSVARPAAAQICVEPPSGLLAWWTGDGDGTEVAADLDALLVGGAGFGPGLVGDAFQIDSMNANPDVSVVLSRLAADGLADFTLELWVSSTDSEGALVSAANGNVGGDNELLIYQSPAALRVFVKQQGGDAVGVFVNDGGWHHVAMVREGAIVRTFVDGALADSRPLPATPLDVGPRGFLLGQEQDCLAGCFDPGQELNGLFDEVAVYNRALSQAEILGIVDAGMAGKCKPPPEPDTDVAILESEIDALGDRIFDLEARLDALDTGSGSDTCSESDSDSDSHRHSHHRRRRR